MNKYDELLKADGPVALTLREYLEPAHGAEAVLFPGDIRVSTRVPTPSRIIWWTESN